MKFLKKIVFILTVLNATILIAQLKYPLTKKVPVIDIYHNIKVIDNYQWLEKIGSPEVLEWVKLQNKISVNYLRKISKKNKSTTNMKAYMWYDMDFDINTSNITNDKMYYRILYPGKNSLPNIYLAKGNKSNFKKLIGPNSISSKDKIKFTGFTPSSDDRFLAYHYNRNGSDWKEIKIVGIKKRHFFEETLKEVLSPQINWYGQGFFYKKNKYDSKKVSRKFPEIMYHKLGTNQSEDESIFNVNNEFEELGIYGTNNQSLYLIKKSDKFKNEFSYYYLKPKSGKKEFKPIYKKIKYDMNVVKFKSDTVVVLTKIKNKNFLVRVPLNEPNKWVLLSPSYSNSVFTNYEFAEEKIVTSFQSEKSSFIVVTDSNGKVLGEVPTPEGMSISNLFYNKNTKEFTFKLSSFTVPPVTCLLDLKTFKYKYMGKSEVNFDSNKYHFIRKKFISHDGKEVPMFIVYKDSIQKNGNTPFLLKTYGGYGRIAKASFDPGVIYFIEKGGAFAYVNVRGGGEFGYNWWQEGRNLKKRNGILDFTNAAKFLINEGFTKPKKIGIMGTSHGGLLTAAAMIEEPELFGAAVINVGALDMIRMENSQTGAAYVNINEFGTVKKKNEFMNILSYSPFHNIKENINYPSSLIITGNNDTRVPPYHSYKFASKLQNRLNQKNPILLWTQDKAGHFGAMKYNTVIEESAFIYSFLINELNKN